MNAMADTEMIGIRFRLAAGGEGAARVAEQTRATLSASQLALWFGQPSRAFLCGFSVAYDASPDWLLFARGPRRLSDACEGQGQSYVMSRMMAQLRGRLGSVREAARAPDARWELDATPSESRFGALAGRAGA
jgi:hypothetical protein